MKRTPLLRKSPLRARRPAARPDSDEGYLQWVRQQLCAVCGHKPPNQAHHATGGGMGMKSPDSEAFPLCHKHHREFHDLNGHFAGWTKQDRKDWQRASWRYHRQTYLEQLPTESTR